MHAFAPAEQTRALLGCPAAHSGTAKIEQFTNAASAELSGAASISNCPLDHSARLALSRGIGGLSEVDRVVLEPMSSVING